jgi:hypothetical protein
VVELPVWDELAERFVDPASGVVLPTWDEALDDIGGGRRASHRTLGCSTHRAAVR